MRAVRAQVKGMHHPMEVFRVSCQHPTDTLEWQEGLPGSPQPSTPRSGLNFRLGSSSSAWAPQALVGRDDVMAQVWGRGGVLWGAMTSWLRCGGWVVSYGA